MARFGDLSADDDFDALVAAVPGFGGGGSSPARFSGHGGGGTFTTTPVTAPITSAHKSDAGFTLASSEVTVAEDGDYDIDAQVTMTVTTNTRTEGQCWLEVDDAEVAGTRAWCYCRMVNFGDTASISVSLALTAGQTVRIRAVRTAGGTLEFAPNGTRLRMKKD